MPEVKKSKKSKKISKESVEDKLDFTNTLLNNLVDEARLLRREVKELSAKIARETEGKKRK